MNKNSIIGFLLIFVILIGYTYLTKPSDEEIQSQRAKLAEQDSLNRLKNQEKIKRLDAQRIEDSIRQSENITTGTGDIIIDSLSKTHDSISSLSPVQKQHFGIFTNAASGNEDEIIIETEKLKLKLNSRGGFFSYVEIKDYDTYDSNKLVLFTDETSNFSFLLDDNRLQSSELYFKPIIKTSLYRDKDSIYLTGDDVVNIAMRVYPDDGFGGIDESKYFEFDYTIGAEQYMLDFKFNINGLSDYIAPGYNSILLNWETDLSGKEKSIEQERMQSTVFYKYYKDDVDELSLRSEEESEDLETKVEWISFKQQFFSMTIIAESSFDEAKVGKSVKNDVDIDNYLQSMFAEIQVPLTGGDLQSIPMKIYYGPNKYKILSKYDYSLDEQIPLGWGFF